MDQHSLPTAAELGISEVEYERILRDLRRSSRGDVPPGPPPSVAGKPRRWLLPLALVSVIAIAVFLRFHEPGPQYAFLQTVGDKPVTYSSCRPIKVAVYPAGGPPDAEELVRKAVARVRFATKLDVVFVGAYGGHADNWDFGSGYIYSDDPISVSWQDGASIDALTDDVAGLGGSRMWDTGGSSPPLGAGTIALSRDYYAHLNETDQHDQAMGILLHEFGHVFGLAHVGSKNELMHASATNRDTYGPGDLKGLKLLGEGPCF